MRLRIERHPAASRWWLFGTYALSILLGFAASGLLLKLSGADVGNALTALFRGAFGSQRAILRTLVAAAPLILTGMAALVVFRARIWSIGQEGQVYAGAMGAYWVASTLSSSPTVVALPLALLGSVAAAGFMAWLAAVLRNRFAINEIFSTVMLNYIIVYLLSYLLAGGPWTEIGATVAYHQSPLLPRSTWLPVIVAPLNAGILVAGLVALLVYLVIEHTAAGYDVKALGANPTALRFMGVRIAHVVVLTMVLSGALAGLAGACELLGVQHRLKADYLAGLGYNGIIVSMVGGLHPLGTVVVAVLFGGLTSGSIDMRVTSGVPDAIVQAMQGTILLCVLAGAALARYRIRWGVPR